MRLPIQATSNTLRIVAFVCAMAWAESPEPATRHDRRQEYLELGVSANTGFPDVFRPQIELMAKRRGLPVFVSGRFGLGLGDWLGHAAVVTHPQVGIHWSPDGDDSWAVRLGWVMGEWFETELFYDPAQGHSSPGQSKLLGNSLAIERTAYFRPQSDLAWRVALGAATAWHQYEFKGSPMGRKTSSILPFVEFGLVWTSF